MPEITRLLQSLQEGNAEAGEQLLSEVYQELRKLAAYKMANELPGQTLQPTALVHEAWVRLAGNLNGFENRRHFFAAAGQAMRRILVEAARRKSRLKRGGRLERTDVDLVNFPAPMPDDQLLAVDEALTRLAEINPRAAEVVNLCFFVRLTQEQAASEIGVSVSTVERLWKYARAWLFRAMRNSSPPSAG